MDIQHPERRTLSSPGQHGIRFDATRVRDGLAIQRQANTSSAAEYLKAKGVSPSVIVRVLSSHTLRNEDRRQLEENAGQPGN
jgi:hypothetical protein